MNSWIMLFMFLIGLFSIMFFSNYLMMLLSIEMIMMSLYLYFISISMKLNISLDLLLIYLSMIIVESVFGLSLLISFSHNFGNDFFLL